jgi:hypothetical protein
MRKGPPPLTSRPQSRRPANEGAGIIWIDPGVYVRSAGVLIISLWSASKSRDQASTSAASNVTVPVRRSPPMSRPLWLTGGLPPVAASCLPIRGDQRAVVQVFPLGDQLFARDRNAG